MKVAVVAGESKILLLVSSTVFSGNDVLDMMRDNRLLDFFDPAVLA